MEDIFPLWMKWKRDYTAVSGKTLQITTQQWGRYCDAPLRYADNRTSVLLLSVCNN